MKALLDALREPADRVMDSVTVALGAHDPSGRLVYVNRAFAQMFDLEPADLIGKFIQLELESGKDDDGLAQLVRGHSRPVEVLIGSKGALRAHVFLPIRVRDEKGLYLGLLYIALQASEVTAVATEHVRALGALATATLAEVAGAIALGEGAAPVPLSELRESVPALARLSAREFEVARRLASGERTAEISRGLGIRPNTVRNHLKAIFRKFDVDHQAAVIAQIRAWSLESRAS